MSLSAPNISRHVLWKKNFSAETRIFLATYKYKTGVLDIKPTFDSNQKIVSHLTP